MIAAVAIAVSVTMFPVWLSGEESTPLPPNVAALLAEYQRHFAKAKDPADKVLRTEATKLAAKLVAAGDTNAAKRLNIQVDERILGEGAESGVDPSENPELAPLFQQYDNALEAGIVPVRQRYAQRVDAILERVSGRDMAMVIALGEVKKLINGEATDILETPPPGNPVTATDSADSIVTNPASGRRVLVGLVEGKTWTFQTGRGMESFTFAKRGELRWRRPDSTGTVVTTWEAEDDRLVAGNDGYEFRVDADGKFGEVLFLTSRNRYRMVSID